MRKYQRSQTMQQRAVPLSQMWSVLLNWMLPCVTLVTGQWAAWVQLGCYPGTDGSPFCKSPVRSTAWITTVEVFPVSLITWTLQGGQLTSFLGSTLWLRRPFFALGSWVTFSCGHYKSNSTLFPTPQNTSLLRRLAMDPWGRGGHLLCPCDISSFKTMWLALTEWFLWAEGLKELMCWSCLDQGDGGFCELGLVLVCFSEHLTNVWKEEVTTCSFHASASWHLHLWNTTDRFLLVPLPAHCWWRRCWTLPPPPLGPHSWTSKTSLHGGSAGAAPVRHRPSSSPYCA